MWRILLDGAEALGAKMRGVNPISSMSQVYLQLAQSDRLRSRQMQTPLSQAWQERLLSGQSQSQHPLLHRLQVFLEQGLLDLYRLREQLMLRQRVSQVRVLSGLYRSARMRPPRSPAYLQQDLWDRFLLPPMRWSVLLVLLALQPLAALQSQVRLTSVSRALQQLAVWVLSLLLLGPSLLLLALMLLVQSVRYPLLALHRLPLLVWQALVRLALYLLRLGKTLVSQVRKALHRWVSSQSNQIPMSPPLELLEPDKLDSR